MQNETIIIIGGGIAGLTAALELADHYSVIILEANNRMGGRIDSQEDAGFSKIIETGPEFIHGHLKNTLHLLKKAGIPYAEVEGKMLRRENGKWKKQEEMIAGWDELLRKMKEIGEDMTLGEFLQQFYSGEENTSFRRQVVRYAEGFDLADIQEVSVRSLYGEWSDEEETNYRIPGGYGSLIRFLEVECTRKRCILRTGQLVRQVDWEKGNARVYTSTGEQYDAGKLIVTIPIGVLQQVAGKASVNFTPALDEYIDAARKIGMGSVIKIIIEFREAFWPKGTGFLLSDESFPTWWTQWPDPVPLLTGWMGGAAVEQWTGQEEGVIYRKALQSLANIFDLSVADVEASVTCFKIFDWKQNEYSLGAYTYATLHSHEARKRLNTPVAGTIFFAGEGLYGGASPGTVEAAIIQAKETAGRLMKS